MLNIDEIRKYDSVFIYGIGRLGKKICHLFVFLGISISGIIVTDKKNTAAMYNGIKISEYSPSDYSKSLFIVAVPSDAVEPVTNMLKADNADVLVWTDDMFSKAYQSCDYNFTDRRKNKDKVLFVLSGYKEFLWNDVFGRIEKFVPDDVDVCICSSGIYNARLDLIAEKNQWSYLYTKQNSVTLIQNIAYSVFDNYSWIYKMDEDIFLTAGSIQSLYDAYIRALNEEPFHIGVIAPLIPLNECCVRYILEKYNCTNDFENRFGKLFFGGDGMIINNVDIAPYMWGKYGNIPDIDCINDDFTENKFTACSTRYNIGLIMFNRSLWEQMGGFSVSGGIDLGADEEELCAYCVNMSRPIMVTHDTVVGHFSFGPQEKAMKSYLYVNEI